MGGDSASLTLVAKQGGSSLLFVGKRVAKDVSALWSKIFSEHKASSPTPAPFILIWGGGDRGSKMLVA